VESQSKDLSLYRKRTVRELVEPLTKILANTYHASQQEPGWRHSVQDRLLVNCCVSRWAAVEGSNLVSPLH